MRSFFILFYVKWLLGFTSFLLFYFYFFKISEDTVFLSESNLVSLLLVDLWISQKTPTAVNLDSFRRGETWISIRITVTLRMASWAAVPLHCLGKEKKNHVTLSITVILLITGSCRHCLIRVLLSCLAKYVSHIVITHLKTRNHHFYPCFRHLRYKAVKERRLACSHLAG